MSRPKPYFISAIFYSRIFSRFFCGISEKIILLNANHSVNFLTLCINEYFKTRKESFPPITRRKRKSIIAISSQKEARAHTGLPLDKKIILYAGSTLGWKGTDIIPEIAKAMPDILFVIVGATEEKKEDNIQYVRKQDLRKVPIYLRAANLLIAPYRSDSERAQRYFSPIKVFEYMASGVPFVTTDLPAVREFLNEENAFLVQEYAPKAFEDAIRFAFNHPEEMAQRAKNARDQSGYFSWQSRAKRIVEFIEYLR